MLDGGDGLMNKKNKGRIRVYSLIGISLIFSMSLMSYLLNTKKNREKKA